MRNHPSLIVTAVIVMAVFQPRVSAQIAVAPQDSNQSSKVPNLAGTWRNDNKRNGKARSISLSDPRGTKRGGEDDIPYQPWALAKTLSEKPLVGSGAGRQDTTDPAVKYCEPFGIPRIQLRPGAFRLVQTPDLVYVFYEQGPNYQLVRLNSKHPEDPDPLWWGDSIGWYENGDTLVVDMVGFKDGTWLDDAGHPQTEQLHLTERFKRVSATTLELNLTVDDPGAYTKPFHSQEEFVSSKRPFQHEFPCSTRQMR
jgi:hypothetical protein